MKKFIIITFITLGIIVLLVILFIPYGMPGTSKPSDNMADHKIEVVAHRGASGHAPENTLPAVDLALKAGADYIEIDVHLTKDSEVVVIHDETVNRTTYGEGRIEEMTLERIRKLDAGKKYDINFKGTKIPLLEEVIERVDGQCKLLIEIKKKKDQYIGIEDKVVELIREYNAAGWCEVQSFNDAVLETIHAAAPEITLHKLIVFKFRFLPYVFDGGIRRFSFDKYDYIYSFNMHKDSFNSRFARKLKEKGKKVFLWGFCDEDPCMELRSALWDGIITDYPAEYRDILSGKKPGENDER
jgi:glycerophosphoryl diester phosphodiesterase